MRFWLNAIVFVFGLSTWFCIDAASAANKTIPPDWAEHLDIIVPGIREAFRFAFWLISSLVTAISILLWSLLKKYMRDRKQEHRAVIGSLNLINNKLDDQRAVMLHCDGCRGAASEIGIELNKRWDDVRKDQCDPS